MVPISSKNIIAAWALAAVLVSHRKDFPVELPDNQRYNEIFRVVSSGVTKTMALSSLLTCHSMLLLNNIFKPMLMEETKICRNIFSNSIRKKINYDNITVIHIIYIYLYLYFTFLVRSITEVLQNE